ncbi:hypothetical protein ABZ357_21675 [Streptomyces sp. NPDC005917]
MVVIQRLPTLSPVKYLKKVAHVNGNHHGADATPGSPGAASLNPPA